MNMIRSCVLLLVAGAFSASCLADSSGTLSVSQNAAGEVIAAAAAWIPKCGITAGDAPTFRIAGHEIDVQQPLIALLCINGVPPDAKEYYARSVNFGRLANGTYTINWSFPPLSTTYTVTGTPLTLGPGFTGSWYDPEQSGHGLQIEMLNTDPPQALVAWYVFAPDGGQAWISGSGPVSGNGIRVAGMQVLGAGALFPPNFDPGRVEGQLWGTLTLTFSDCNHGQLAWHSTLPGYGDGVLPITRLTLPAGLSCP